MVGALPRVLRATPWPTSVVVPPLLHHSVRRQPLLGSAVMTWEVRLQGESQSLRRLGELFAAGDPIVEQDADGSYVLKAAAMESVDRADATTRAEEVVELLNGVARLIDPTIAPVRFGEQVRHPVHGNYLRAGLLKVGVRVQSIDPANAASLAREYFHLGVRNGAVAEVLRLLSDRQLEWVVLWKISEIIIDDVGGKKGLLANKSQFSSFGAAANRPDVSGDKARHARLPGAPPAHAMTLKEGQTYIRRVVRDWLQSLPGPPCAGSTES